MQRGMLSIRFWSHDYLDRRTFVRLDLNDMRYPESDSIRATRRFWLQTGLHPPLSDLPLES